MKKKMLAVLIAGVCITTFFPSTLTAWSPVKFSLWPGVWSVPSDTKINGVNFGLITCGKENKEVVGLDIGFAGYTKNITGAQMSMVNYSKNVGGVQFALFNFTEKLNGTQISFGNDANNAKNSFQLGMGNMVSKAKSFFQLGLYNIAEKGSHGFQLGFVNIMDNGILPVCLFFNFSK